MNKKNIIKFISIVILASSILALSGCGKHEAEGGTFGTAMGAVAGAALCNKHNMASGAIIGGAIGHAFGRLAGAKEDKDEDIAKKDAIVAKNENEISSLKQENYALQKSLEKWCPSCRKKYSMRGANSCPCCGDSLIIEKFCKNCKTFFSPEYGYNYCPYCRDRILLSCR